MRFRWYKKKPVPLDRPVWRYMECWKFIDLLERRAAYFSTLDELRNDKNGDKKEGQYSTPTRKILTEMFDDYNKIVGPGIYDLDKGQKERDQYVRVNCWNMNDKEKLPLWNTYGKAKVNSVAIMSTIEKLIDSLDERYWIIGGEVEYIDHEIKVNFPLDDRCFQKDEKQFEDDEEFRLKVEGSQIHGTPIFIPMNLNVLIEMIVVAPTAHYDRPIKLEEILRKHGIEKKVVHSSLRTSSS